MSRDFRFPSPNPSNPLFAVHLDSQAHTGSSATADDTPAGEMAIVTLNQQVISRGCFLSY